VAYVLRFGYGYGSSDQDEFLPLVMHRLDPSLFTADWFVQTQVASFSIRTFVSRLVQAMAVVLPLPVAVFGLYAAAWFGIAAGIYRLASHLTGDVRAGALTIPLVLIATPYWTLGGNEFVHSMFVPSMLGWALGLAGWSRFIADGRWTAGLWIGVATWMQALVGLHLALLALFAPPASFLLAFGIAAAPGLGPLFYQQFSAEPPAGVDLFYVMAAFRNPHHYLFDSFPPRSIIHFGLLATAGLAAWAALRHRVAPGTLRTVGTSLVVVGVVGCGAYVATEWLHFLPVAKLQLFMLTVPAKLLLGIGIAGAIVAYLPAGIVHRATRFLERPIAHVYALGLLLVAGLALDRIAPERVSGRIYPFREQVSMEAPMEHWVRQHTPLDAVVAIPPSVSSFRTRARRAIVVNHKAFPYRDADIADWFARLTDVAPLPLPTRSDAALTARLDSAYEAVPAGRWRTLSERYGIDYLVRRSPLRDSAGFEPVYTVAPWWVYRIPEESP
jgi:hypothetical protein